MMFWNKTTDSMGEKIKQPRQNILVRGKEPAVLNVPHEIRTRGFLLGKWLIEELRTTKLHT